MSEQTDKEVMSITILMLSLTGAGKTKATIDLANALSSICDVTIATIRPLILPPSYPIEEAVKVVSMMDFGPKDESPAIAFKIFSDDVTVTESNRIEYYLKHIETQFFYIPNMDSPLYWLVEKNLPKHVISILGDHGGRRNNSLESVVEKNCITAYHTDYYFGSAAKAFDAIHCINPLNADIYKKLNENIINIPNICSLPEANTTDIDREDKIILVGSLNKIKQHHKAIRAFARVHKRHPSWTMHIYGYGGLENKLIELIERLDLKERVFLEGKTNNIQDKYSESKLYLSASNFESFGLTYVEAMLNGLQIMSFDGHLGARYLLSDGRGILVEHNDIKGLAIVLFRTLVALSKPSLERDQLLESNKEFARQFKSENLVEAWRQSLHDLIIVKKQRSLH